MGDIDRLTFIRRFGIRKRNVILQFRFQMFICDDLATSYKNLVKFGLVTLEFKKGNHVLPLVDQQFGNAAPLLDPAAISTEFSGGDHYSVLFHSYARGRHCYAARATRRLCHAFLVTSPTEGDGRLCFSPA